MFPALNETPKQPCTCPPFKSLAHSGTRIMGHLMCDRCHGSIEIKPHILARDAEVNKNIEIVNGRDCDGRLMY